MPETDLLEKIQELQKTDKKCCQIAKKLDEGLEIAPKYMQFFFRDDILMCEDSRDSPILNKLPKLVVPKELIPQVFALTHDSLAACHQAFQKTIDRIRENFYWPGMSADVKHLVESCISCQQRRAYRPKHLAPLQRMPTPEFPLAKVNFDIIGPLPVTFSGNKFIVTYIDAFSKWPEAYAVSSITSDVVADTLADFVSRYGAPSYIVSYKGKNLMSEAIERVYKNFGMKHIHTSAYHPAGNSQIEHQNRTLINALCHVVNENQSDWDTKLKFALLALRTAVHSSTKLTPAAVMFGRNLNLPYKLFSTPQTLNYNDAPTYCELLFPALKKVYAEVHSSLVEVSEKQEKYREKTAVSKNLKIGDSVWLFTPAVKPGQCKKLSKFNNGPYTITEKINEVNFKIALQSNLKLTQVVHVDRLTEFKNRHVDFQTNDQLPQQQIDDQSNIQNPTTSTHQSINDNPERRTKKRRRAIFIPPATAAHRDEALPMQSTASTLPSLATSSEPLPPSLPSAEFENSRAEPTPSPPTAANPVTSTADISAANEVAAIQPSVTPSTSRIPTLIESQRKPTDSIPSSRNNYGFRNRNKRPNYKL